MTEPTDPTVTAPVVAPQTFSLEYVKELRSENASWRRKAGDNELAATAATTAATEAQTAATARIEAAVREATDKATATVTEAMTKADARVITAELRAACVKAGMVDLDGIKMLDASSVKLNANGEVEGVDALIASTKTAKPYLFGAASTSSTATTPPAKPPGAKLATEMTDDEFNAAMASKSYRNK